MTREEVRDRAASPPAPAREVPRLLEMYGRALDDAAALPPLFVWVSCRPSRWRLLRPFAKLPRLTVATHILLVRHIDRNLATLIRHYSVREALGIRTAEEARDQSSCIAFRNCLPPSKLGVTVLGIAIPAMVAALFLTPIMARLSARAMRKTGRISDALQRLAREALNLVTGGGGGGLLNEIGEAMKLGTDGLSILLLIVLVTSYLATRPLVSAFRLKRQILNLAGQDELEVKDTASSWFTNKSVGAYAQERRVVAALGLRRRAYEHPLDLATLAFPAVCVLLLAFLAAYALWSPLIGNAIINKLNSQALTWYERTTFVCLFAWLALLCLLRFKWLADSRQGRLGIRLAPPMAYVTSRGEYLETRPVPETAAWPLATSPPISFTLPNLYCFLGAAQFYRLALTEDRVRAEVARRDGRPHRRGFHLVATTAFVSMYFTPLAVSVLLWRVATLLDRRHPFRRYRALAALAWLPLIAPGFILPLAPREAGWRTAGYFLLSLSTLLYPVLIAAIQQCQNHLVPRLMAPVPYGLNESRRRSLAPDAEDSQVSRRGPA